MTTDFPHTPKNLLGVARQAAAVCRSLFEEPALLSRTEAEISAIAKVGEMTVTLTLAALRDLGWIGDDGRFIRLLVPSTCLRRLADRLEGAADSQESLCLPLHPEVILTRPKAPSVLVDALEKIDAPSTYWTRDSFVHLAEQACESLRIMTPFVDQTGADLLAKMFNSTSASHRLLVLRPTYAGERPWLNYLSAEIFRRVAIREYWLEARDGEGLRRVETFHAKAICADARLAYVGSSNFVSSSLDRSLECGVLIRDREAKTVAALMDAVESISTEVQLL